MMQTNQLLNLFKLIVPKHASIPICYLSVSAIAMSLVLLMQAEQPVWLPHPNNAC